MINNIYLKYYSPTPNPYPNLYDQFLSILKL